MKNGTVEDHRRYWSKLIGPRVGLVEDYWLQYPPPAAWVNYSIAVFVAVVGLISIFGNLLVCYAFLQSPSQRKARLFHVNLSLSDGLSCLLTYHMFVVSSVQGIWVFSVAACHYYAMVQGFFGIMSIISLAAIALERFAAISEAENTFFKNMSIKRKLMIILGIWVYCFVVICPPMFGVGNYVAAGYLTTCCFDYIKRDLKTKLFITELFTAGLILPMLIIIYAYYRIYQAAKLSNILLEEKIEMRMAPETLQLGRNRGHGRLDTSVENTSTGSTMLQQKRVKSKDVRVARLMFTVIVLFVLAWTPYGCVALLGQFGPEGWVQPWMAMIPSVFAKSSTVWNPLLYGIKDSRFKRAFNKYVMRDTRALVEGTESLTTKTQSEMPLHRYFPEEEEVVHAPDANLLQTQLHAMV